MWALGKILKGTPEVPKLVVGSFWDAEMPFDFDEDVEDAVLEDAEEEVGEFKFDDDSVGWRLFGTPGTWKWKEADCLVYLYSSSAAK